MQQRSLSIQSVNSAAYTTGASFANITGLVITVPEGGNYDVYAGCCCLNDTNGDQTNTRLAVNGNACGGGLFEDWVSGGIGIFPHSHNVYSLSLKAGDVVSLQAYYGGSATVVRSATGFIQVVKRGV